MPKGNPRKHHIGFLLTGEELQKLEKAICGKNITISDYLRELLFKAFEKEGV